MPCTQQLKYLDSVARCWSDVRGCPGTLRRSTQAPPADEEGDEDGTAAAPRAKPSGIGRVLNGGLPLACGHCKGETEGVGGELTNVDVSPQGVRTLGESFNH